LLISIEKKDKPIETDVLASIKLVKLMLTRHLKYESMTFKHFFIETHTF